MDENNDVARVLIKDLNNRTLLHAYTCGTKFERQFNHVNIIRWKNGVGGPRSTCAIPFDKTTICINTFTYILYL